MRRALFSFKPRGFRDFRRGVARNPRDGKTVENLSTISPQPFDLRLRLYCDPWLFDAIPDRGKRSFRVRYENLVASLRDTSHDSDAISG